VAFAAADPSQLAPKTDASSMARQPGPEHIGHMTQLCVLTNRAVDSCFGTDLSARTHQFGVSIAGVVVRELPRPKRGHRGVTSQAVVDGGRGNTIGGCVFASRRWSKHHAVEGNWEVGDNWPGAGTDSPLPASARRNQAAGGPTP